MHAAPGQAGAALVQPHFLLIPLFSRDTFAKRVALQ